MGVGVLSSLQQAETVTSLFQHVVVEIPAEPVLGMLKKRLFSRDVDKN